MAVARWRRRCRERRGRDHNAHGLDLIGVNDPERVDISRSAGTSLIAPESLAGTVNMVTKRPTCTGGEVDLSSGTFGHRRAAGYASKTFTGGALVLGGTLQRHGSVDQIGGGLSRCDAARATAASPARALQVSPARSPPN